MRPVENDQEDGNQRTEENKTEERYLTGCSVDVKAEVRLPDEQFSMCHFFVRALFHESDTEEKNKTASRDVVFRVTQRGNEAFNHVTYKRYESELVSTRSNLKHAKKNSLG